MNLALLLLLAAALVWFGGYTAAFLWQLWYSHKYLTPLLKEMKDAVHDRTKDFDAIYREYNRVSAPWFVVNPMAWQFVKHPDHQ